MVKLKCNFPQSFFKEEEKCGYMVSAQMKKVWAVEIDLLYELTRVCNQYNIHFYVCGGTLLGTIRHRGMIPWDDDIDVMMFRKDYKRLCEIGEKEFQHPYFFQTEYTDRGSLRGHAQLRNSETTGILKTEYGIGCTFNQGIFIDIFPMDYVPDDENERRKYLKCAKKLFRRCRTKAYQSVYYKFKLRKNVFIMTRDLVMHMFYKLCRSASYFDYGKAYREFELYSQSYNETETQSLITVPFYKEKNIKERSWFKETVYLPFEFMYVPAFSGYDELLRKVYGDYQKFVIGTSLHGGVVFDTEKSYKEYLK